LVKTDIVYSIGINLSVCDLKFILYIYYTSYEKKHCQFHRIVTFSIHDITEPHLFTYMQLIVCRRNLRRPVATNQEHRTLRTQSSNNRKLNSYIAFRLSDLIIAPLVSKKQGLYKATANSLLLILKMFLRRYIGGLLCCLSLR